MCSSHMCKCQGQETYKFRVSAAAVQTDGYLAQQVVVRITVQRALRPSGPEPH